MLDLVLRGCVVKQWTISIDPGRNTALALFEGQDLILVMECDLGAKATTLNGRSWAVVSRLQSAWKDDRGPVSIVAEDQYVGANAKSALHTAMVRGLWCGALAMAFPLPPVHVLMPQVWQGHWGIKGKREARKAQSLATVRRLYPSRVWDNDNRSDAVLLGLAFIQQREANKAQGALNLEEQDK